MLSVHVLYMVLSGLAFASLDLVRKLLAGRIAPLALTFYMALGAVPLLAALLWWQGAGNPSPSYIPPAGAALLLNFFASLGFIYSVKLSPLSLTIPLLSLTPVFTALAAIPILGETPSREQTAGILLVVGGALALNSDGHVLRPFRGLLRERGALIMTGVALLWSLSGPMDKMALRHASVPFHATMMTLGVSLGALLVLWWQGRLETLRKGRGQVWLLIASMISVTLALTFQLLAIQGVFVSLVEAFKRCVGSILAVVLGRIVFAETIRTFQVMAVLVMAVGVVLILT